MPIFGRVLTAMITPFRDDGQIDHEKAWNLARHLASHGSDGLVVTGTTGESPTLSEDEKVAPDDSAILLPEPKDRYQ